MGVILGSGEFTYRVHENWAQLPDGWRAWHSLRLRSAGYRESEGDFVIGMDIIENEDEQQVLTVSANGYGKRTKVSDWRAQNRGGKGIIAMDTSERNGALVKLRLVSPDDQLMDRAVSLARACSSSSR